METFKTNRLGLLLAAGLLSALLGCGGGGGSGGVQTGTGIFKDSNVSGATYTSGAQSGITGPDGSFVYEVGQQVTFSIGSVTLGSAAGKPVVTPLDLVNGSDSTTPEVQNIVRFLTMLDVDGDPNNGISISQNVQAQAPTWGTLDFTDANWDTAVGSIVISASNADGTPHTLPAPADAQAHVESTLRCLRSGGYRGTYTGTDSGPFGVVVDAATGKVSGFAFSTSDQERIDLTGTTAVSADQNASFVTGNTTSGSTFNGTINSSDQISGSWENGNNDSGEFSGSRVGSVSNPVHRFTGRFFGTARGFFTFDVDANNAVSGVAYTLDSDDEVGLVVNEIGNITGTVDNVALSISIDGGGVATGTLDRASGELRGFWSDNPAQGSGAGDFFGSGCKLN